MTKILQMSFAAIILLLMGMSALAQKIKFNDLASGGGAALAIGQDSQGFIWFMTGGGVSRHGTRGYTAYKQEKMNPKSLSSNYATSCLRDSKGNFWVGTTNGLNLFDVSSNSFSHTAKDSARLNSLSHNAVFSIFEDKGKNLWVGTGNGLDRLVDFKNGIFEHYSLPLLGGQSLRFAKTITQDYNGNIWIGTEKGLVRFGKNKQMESYPLPTAENAGQFVNSIFADGNVLWVGTESLGLLKFDLRSNTFLPFIQTTAQGQSLDPSIRKVLRDRSGRLFICTANGLGMIGPTGRLDIFRHDASQSLSLGGNDLLSAFEDDAGNVWISSYHGSAQAIFPEFTPFEHIAPTTGSPQPETGLIYSVRPDNNRLWLSTDNGMLTFDKSGSKFQNAWPQNGGDQVQSVVCSYKTIDGQIWTGGLHGEIHQFNPVTKKRLTYKLDLFKPASATSADVTDIVEDGSGRLWFGTYGGGILMLDRRTEKFARFPITTSPAVSLGANYVRCLERDTSGDLWIGTVAGIARMRKETENLEWFPAVNASPESSWEGGVHCAFANEAGQVWFGTSSTGLRCFDTRKGVWRSYQVDYGIPQVSITNIVTDLGGQVWFTSGGELWRFDPVKNVIKNYTTSDGLSGYTFPDNAIARDENGAVWIGELGRLLHFMPNRIRDNPGVGRLVFTGIRLFNKPVAIGDDSHILQKSIETIDALELRHDQNVFSIDFQLLSFVKPEKNRYAYRLDGFEKSWNYTDNPSVTYTNLSPGTYRLQIKGANNDGIWAKSIFLTIRVLPPWYATWWSYLLYIATICLTGFLIFRYFWSRESFKKGQQLQQAKLDFFTNISHEIRTHLSMITGPTERLLNSEFANQETEKHLNRIKSNTDRLLKLVNELMDFRRTESNQMALHVNTHDLVAFLKGILYSFQDASDTKTIKSSYVGSQNPVMIYFDPYQMNKVVSNLLGNAYKFTAKENGLVQVNLVEMADLVQIRITDNGKGIPKEYLGSLFNNFFQVYEYGERNTGYGIGLALSKRIVELHHGELTVESRSENEQARGYTTFIITLKKGKDHFTEEELHAEAYDVELELPRQPAEIPQNSSEGRQSEDPSRPSILLIEDNEELRSFIRDIFYWQYVVLECTDGVSGFDTALEVAPDLIITDVMMPGMNGFELCQQLKTNEYTHHIPVIMLTAKTAVSDQIQGLETGADVYIGKPFSTQVLELHVRNLLQGQKLLRDKYTQRILFEATNVEVSSTEEKFVSQLIEVTERCMSEPGFGVEKIAREIGMSRPLLYKKLKEATGLSVNEFTKTLRLKRAAEMLLQKQYNINEIADAVGFDDRRYFTREFGKMYGVSPSEYAKRALN